MTRSHRVLLAGLLLVAVSAANEAAADNAPAETTAPLRQSPTPSPLYLLTYDHGGLVLWGREHFAAHLRSAVSWLDRYPSFKIGLDNEAYTYDRLAEEDPALLEEALPRLSSPPSTTPATISTYVSTNTRDMLRGCHWNIPWGRRT